MKTLLVATIIFNMRKIMKTYGTNIEGAHTTDSDEPESPKCLY